MDLTHWTLGWEEAAAGAVFLLLWIVFLGLVLHYRKAGRSRRDKRFDHRFKTKDRGWFDVEGKRCSFRAIDLNNSGALIATRRPVPTGSDVFVYLTTAGLMGWAQVRHCARNGSFRYQIGLQFRGPLMHSQEGNWQYASSTVPAGPAEDTGSAFETSFSFFPNLRR
jgi:hypothetical protein